MTSKKRHSKATESYMMFSSIAMDIIQMQCLDDDGVSETEFISFYGSAEQIGHNKIISSKQVFLKKRM